MRKRKWLIAIIVGVWLSTSITMVPGQSVKTYRVLAWEGRTLARPVVPLVNEKKGFSFRLKWPLFLGGIGFFDETLSMNPDKPNHFKTKIGIAKSSHRGGDADSIDALIIEGYFIIRDPVKFFANIDLDEINAQVRREPLARRFKTREEILGEIFKNVITPQELRQRVNLWEHELLWRRNFILGVVTQLGFTELEAIKTFIKEQAPWFWMGYESFWDQKLEAESFNFRYNYEPSFTRGSKDRRIFDPNDPLKLHYEMIQAAWAYGEFAAAWRDMMPKIEKAQQALNAKAAKDEVTKKKFGQAVAMLLEFKNFVKRIVPAGIGAVPEDRAEALQNLANQYVAHYVQRAKQAKQVVPDQETIAFFYQLVSIEWTKASLELQKAQWDDVVSTELVPYFTNLLKDQSAIGQNWRRLYTLKETEALWDFVIGEVLDPQHFKNIEQWMGAPNKGGALWKVLTELNNVRAKAGREMLSAFVLKHAADIIKDRLSRRIALFEAYTGVQLTAIKFTIEQIKQTPGEVDPDFYDLYDSDR